MNELLQLNNYFFLGLLLSAESFHLTVWDDRMFLIQLQEVLFEEGPN